MILTPRNYASQHPDVPAHMIEGYGGRSYVARHGLAQHEVWPEGQNSYRSGSLRGAFGLSCAYPGGFVSVGLWNVEKWYATYPKRSPVSRKIADASEWTQRKWAIRIFDYDDGNTVAFYDDSRQKIDAVWAVIDKVKILNIERDLIPLGDFRTE